MLTLTVRLVVVLTALATATMSLTAVSHADHYHPPTELLGDGPTPIPLKNAAMIKETDGGFRYIAGQQDSHLTVTIADGKLRFEDTGTAELREIPSSCQRQRRPRGIAALCTIPAKFHDAHGWFVEIWPRLGDDYVDGSALPSTVRFWVLADAGRDTVFAGAGDDFVNGAQDTDRVCGQRGPRLAPHRHRQRPDLGWRGRRLPLGRAGRQRRHVAAGTGTTRCSAATTTTCSTATPSEGDAEYDVLNCGGGQRQALLRLPGESAKVKDCETGTRF